jgi:hypothetical protein
MSHRFSNPEVAVHSTKAATGVGTTVNVEDFQHIVVKVSAAVNSTLTFKFQGSISDTGPDFSAAQSATNHWDYVSAYDLQDPSSVIVGDTGVSLNNDTVANNTHLYLINTDGLRWFNISVTAYTDGSLTAAAVGFTNV